MATLGADLALPADLTAAAAFSLHEQLQRFAQPHAGGEYWQEAALPPSVTGGGSLSRSGRRPAFPVRGLLSALSSSRIWLLSACSR